MGICILAQKGDFIMAKFIQIGLIGLLLSVGILNAWQQGASSYSGVHASTADFAPATTTSSRNTAIRDPSESGWNNGIGSDDLSTQLTTERELHHL